MSTHSPPMMKASAKATAPMLIGIAVATMNMITRPMIVAICGLMRPPRHVTHVQRGWRPAIPGRSSALRTHAAAPSRLWNSSTARTSQHG
ncbi:hypothetical protein G6F24_018364 [Rhizopus arrhizus]|nr:hypothetical protein G6F24_018364 [Rhizopus arrhizus]